MKTTVVNIRDGVPYDVYVGRSPEILKGPDAVWGNPFKIGIDGDRIEVIMKFGYWILEKPDLIARAQTELCGKILGCFCLPQLCHGTILAILANDGPEALKAKLHFIEGM